MKLKNNLLSLLVLGLLLCQASARPSPQDEDVKEKIKVVDEDKEKEDDAMEAVGDALTGLFAIFNQAVKAAGDFATNKEVVETVGEIFEAGVKTSFDVAKTAVDLASEAPKIVEKSVPLVDGLAKTISETSGFVESRIEELEQTSKLVAVFAEAYTNHTVGELDEFLKLFNKRLHCNTDCRKLKGENKKQCEKKYCEGFVPPKTQKEIEEEKLQFVNEYNYEDYDENEKESSNNLNAKIVE